MRPVKRWGWRHPARVPCFGVTPPDAAFSREGTATGLSSAVEAIGAGIVTLLKRGCGREARDALRGVALNACIVLAAMLTHMGPSSLGVGNS